MRRWEAERLAHTVFETPSSEVVNHLILELGRGGRPGSQRWRIIRQLLSAGILPTEDLVMLRLKEQSRRANAEAADARGLVDVMQEPACNYVAERRRVAGEGPSWRELSAHLGLSHKVGRRLIGILLEHGDLVSSTQPHSLDVPSPSVEGRTELA